MKTRLLNTAVGILLEGFCLGQERWFPTKPEVQKLDSIITERFKESSCYDSNETYNIDHIFVYDYFEDMLKRSDFIDKSVLKKIKKQYFPYRYCYPQTIEKLFTKYKSDSLHPMLDEDYDVIKKNVLWVSVSFITDSSDKLVAYWNTMDSHIFCTNEYSSKSLNLLYNFLKNKEFTIVFRLASSGGENYLGLTKEGNIEILTYSDKDEWKKISLEELTKDYWQNFDVFKFDKE
ncbi:MAG: hypothetical protein A2W85_02870 [Bacteroidetes bacterium GWF2_41_31]|nr:MAG: hypothetical protein A2W85_02870 [Bacteroidetes bacterium GWF2_41_31]